jgi:hypothetical protein
MSSSMTSARMKHRGKEEKASKDGTSSPCVLPLKAILLLLNGTLQIKQYCIIGAWG